MICSCGREAYSKGMCKRCYDRHLYKTNKEFRERKKLKGKKWREKQKKADPKYYKKYNLNRKKKLKISHTRQDIRSRRVPIFEEFIPIRLRRREKINSVLAEVGGLARLAESLHPSYTTEYYHEVKVMI